MKVHFIAVSQNAKTGPIPVSIIERASCWPGCAPYENGCNAETGILTLHWARVITENGLVGEGDHALAGVGGDELLQHRAVDGRTVSGQIAGLPIAPQTAGPECRDLGAELGPGPAGETAGDAGSAFSKAFGQGCGP
ncbi:MAG: hypothetical protein WB760_32760 [Xanthobacteraceae bacterium]